MTDSDLNAVWQYLSAIPCTTNQPPNINANVAVTENYGGGILAKHARSREIISSTNMQTAKSCPTIRVISRGGPITRR